jgi:hypothetical protein
MLCGQHRRRCCCCSTTFRLLLEWRAEHRWYCQTQGVTHCVKIERIISLLSTSPEGEVRCRCQNGMAFKD